MSQAATGRHLPLAGFFFVATIARAVLLSILPLKALALLGSAQHVSVLFFAVSIFGIGISLGVYSILRHVSLYAGFLVSLLVMTVSIFLLSTESLFAFSLGMVFHIFGITAMEVILNLYVMQRVPRGQLSQFEPWRMIAAVAALSIGPWLGVYLQTSYGAWVPFVVALFGSLMTLIYFKGLGLHHLDIRRHPVGSNLIKNIKRFLEQPRLRLAWILTLARSGWWQLFIIYTPIYAVHTGLGELWGSAIVSIGSAWTLTVPFWGWIARRYSLRLLMRTGFVMTSLATTAHVDEDVKVGEVAGELKRVPNDELGAFALEVGVDIALVDGDVAVSGAKVDASHGGLASAGAVVLRGVGHRVVSQTYSGKGCGFWAA